MIQVTVSKVSSGEIVQKLRFETQAKADAWVSELAQNPDWYPAGEKYQTSTKDISDIVAAEIAKLQDIKAAITRIDSLDVNSKFQSATTVSAVKSAVVEVLADVVQLLRSRS